MTGDAMDSSCQAKATIVSTSLEVTKGMTTTTALTPNLYKATAPKFPPETFDAIIDRVHALNEGAEKLLGVCSLVCKSWIPRSRYHLFQRVVIVVEAKSFLDLLDSPLCTFKPYVELIQLNEAYNLEDALRRFSTLHAVRDLEIVEGIFTSQDSLKILSNFQNLQGLVLRDCYYMSSPALFLETLSICTSLKSISLYDLDIIHSDSSVNSLPPSSLRSIRIRDADISNDILEWLVSGEQVPAIETLCLYIQKAESQSRAIGNCLQRLGPSLKNLEVGFTNDRFRTDSQNAFLRDVDLSHNTNLNSIVFRTCLVQIASLLAQVTSSEVREVVLDVGWPTAVMGPVDWDAIARILGQPNFSKLENLIISTGESAGAADQIRHWMIQRLPQGRARDKLTICEEWSENYF